MREANEEEGGARLVPGEPLPPYSYVTGRYPHPTRDPAGHSFGHAPLAPAAIDSGRWQASRAYLFGCDLFNYGYYWEAHEVWESLWQASGRRGMTADFLKALIKLAAAGVKSREGRAEGVRRHAARAAQLLEGVRKGVDDKEYLGLDLDWLVEMVSQLEARPVVGKSPRTPVEIVFGFRLWPAAE